MDKELLLKYVEGSCSDHEKVAVTEWIDASAENMKEYVAVRKLYDITIWQTVPPVKLNEKKSYKRIYTEIIKIAAVLIIGILISRYVLRYNSSESSGNNPRNATAMQKLHVPAGQRAEITLADGTDVWLNAQTTLSFPAQFTGNIREVQLDGEAYFDVTHDKSHPFIVKTSKYDVKVWGTRFNLLAYSQTDVFETSLFEGSVEVLKPGGTQGILINPNEKAFVRDNQLLTGVITHVDQFLWKEGIISFDNESFPEMVKKLELYFELNIEVQNKNILKYRCTGKFRTKDGVEQILKVLQLSNKFKYTINEKRNTIHIE